MIAYCHLDYIRYRFKGLPYNTFVAVRDILKTIGSFYVSYGSFQIAKGTKAFKSCLRGFSFRFIYSIDKSEGNKKESFSGYLEFTGKFFEGDLSSRLRYDILRQIYHLSSGVSRVDVSTDIDGYNPLVIQGIKDCMRDRMIRGCRTMQDKTSYHVSSGVWNEHFSVSLGSRESPRYLRIYTTKNTHDYDYLRFECELKRFYADDFCSTYFKHNVPTLEGENNIFFASMQSFEFCDSIDRYVCNGKIKKIVYASWYQDLLDLRVYKSERYTVKPQKPEISNTLNWLFRQVSKSLYLMKKVSNGLFNKALDVMMNIAERKITDRDKYLIRNFTELSSDIETELRDYIELDKKLKQCDTEGITYPLTYCKAHKSDISYKKDSQSEGYNVSQLVLEYYANEYLL